MEPCEIPRWQILKSTLSNLEYDEFIERVANDENAICIDVRTPEEYQQGTIGQAMNINYLSTNLADQLEALDPSKNYYIYCRTGRRSLRVCVILRNMGFKHVQNLISGINGYELG